MIAIADGIDHLIANDERMARACALAGRPADRRRPPGFPALVGIIINQQVSQQAGKAIRERLEQHLGRIAPETVLGASADRLRASGLSRAKADYVRAAADAIVTGALDLKTIESLGDDEARARLVAIKGIGRWSADIYLMFALGRADIWPVGDLALQASAGRLLGLPERPGPKELEEIGRSWRPWRSAAAVILWQYYRHVRRLGD